MEKKLLKYAKLFYKYAQISSPNVTVTPSKAEALCAVEILKLYDPQYFIGVEEIKLGPEGAYGHVESGEGKNPAIININADRVINEGGASGGKAAAITIASIIAHERAHVKSFDKEQGFVGGESPALQEEAKFKTWLDSPGTMQKIENLSCYKSLK